MHVVASKPRADKLELRILEELTFIADHILSLEKQFREVLVRLETKEEVKDNFRLP